MGLYHSDDWNSEKLPLLTLIWVRKYSNYESCCLNCCSRFWDFIQGLGLSILYMLTRVGVPIWLLIVVFSGALTNGKWAFSVLDRPPDLESLENTELLGGVSGVGIAVVVSLTVIKDIQKCFWWFLIFCIAYKPKKTNKSTNRYICIFLSLSDLLTVILCSFSFYLWVWFILLSTFREGNCNLLFSMTTLPGLLIMQEIDERIGNFLRSGSPIGFEKMHFTFLEKKNVIY